MGLRVEEPTLLWFEELGPDRHRGSITTESAHHVHLAGRVATPARSQKVVREVGAAAARRDRLDPRDRDRANLTRHMQLTRLERPRQLVPLELVELCWRAHDGWPGCLLENVERLADGSVRRFARSRRGWREKRWYRDVVPQHDGSAPALGNPVLRYVEEEGLHLIVPQDTSARLALEQLPFGGSEESCDILHDEVVGSDTAESAEVLAPEGVPGVAAVAPPEIGETLTWRTTDDDVRGGDVVPVLDVLVEQVVAAEVRGVRGRRRAIVLDGGEHLEASADAGQVCDVQKTAGEAAAAGEQIDESQGPRHPTNLASDHSSTLATRVEQGNGGRVEESPMPSSAAVSERMSAARRRDTAAEMRVRREAHRRGLRYRVDAPLPGMPRRRADLLFSRARVAVFVDGCFWHACPEHRTSPKANGSWWAGKLAKNVERDRDTDRHLENIGWTVLRFWEHEEPEPVVDRIVVVVRNQYRETQS